MKVMVFDVGGTGIKYSVMDEQLNRTDTGSTPTPADSQEHFLNTLREIYLPHKDEVDGIALSLPGFIDAEQGVVKGGGAPSIIYNIGTPVGPRLAEKCGCKVWIENDGKAAAIAELQRGALQGCSNAAVFVIGTGVGGGVIVNGKVIDGSHGAGGEIGHITVNRHETATCGCGKHGCLEQYSSATGVVRCMKKLLDENPDIPCTLRGIDFAAKDVFDAARSGDALAAREVDEMTDTLGMALASIAATTDPEMFMIGGGVARAGEVLFAPLREHYKTYAFKSCRETPIVAATLGNDAGIYGSVRLIVGE